MALWTPYAEKALDLTKTVKREISSDRCFRPTEYSYSTATPGLEQENRCYSYCEYNIPQSQISSNENNWNYSKVPLPPQPEDTFDVDSFSEDVEYQAFERDALRAMAEKNGGSLLGNNPRMRRAVQANQEVDESYKKQRERNNYAAKQSRDRRKLREVRLAFQVTFLKKKIAVLRSRLEQRVCLRCQRQCRC